ncbi:hypothetical protein ACWDUL_20375 [Nocardia niigatensis]
MPVGGWPDQELAGAVDKRWCGLRGIHPDHRDIPSSYLPAMLGHCQTGQALASTVPAEQQHARTVTDERYCVDAQDAEVDRLTMKLGVRDPLAVSQVISETRIQHD